MKDNLMLQIKNRISNMDKATIFSNSYFFDLASDNIIRMYMTRLVKEKVIGRIINGLFFKLEKMNIIDDYIYPSISEVSLAISLKFAWNIYPDGVTSLNILGLSTQVPAKYVFISDGPYREFKIFNNNIKFKHTANKEISNISYKTSLIIQSLKTLGKEGITLEHKKIIKSKLSNDDLEILKKETQKIPNWIRSEILDITNF